MIRRILKGAATVASLPVWVVGNALMVPLLKRQLRRETAKVQSLTVDLRAKDIEYDQAEGARREAEDMILRIEDRAEAAEAEVARLTAAHDGAAAEYQTLVGQLEALRSAVGEALRFIAHSQKHRDRSPETLIWNTEVALRAALDAAPSAQGAPSIRVPCHAFDWQDCPSDGTPPVQDAPPTSAEARAHMRSMSEPFFSARRRPPVEGDHPANDPVTPERPDSGPAQCCHCGAIYAPSSGHACPVAALAKEALKEFAGERPTAVDYACRKCGGVPIGTDGKRAMYHRQGCEVLTGIINRAMGRPPVEGDHPADERTQQFASVIEHLTKQRDEDARRLEAAWRERNRFKDEVTDLRNDRAALRAALDVVSRDRDNLEKVAVTRFDEREALRRERDTLRREVDTLKRELAEADRVHDGVVAELKARHREVLAERDQTIARLRTKGWAP